MTKISQTLTSNSLTVAKTKASSIPDEAPVDNKALAAYDWQLRLLNKGAAPSALMPVVLGSCITSLLLVSVAFETSLPLLFTLPFLVASTLTFAVSMVLAFTLPIDYDSSGRKRKARKKAYKKWVKQLDFKDSVQGWRPREGAPHPNGRTDTHNRFVVDARQENDRIYLTVKRWVYSPPKAIYDNKLSYDCWKHDAEKVWQCAGAILLTSEEIAAIEKSVGKSNYNITGYFVFDNDEDGLLQMQLVTDCLRECCAEKERTLHHQLIEAELVAEEKAQKRELAEKYIQTVNQMPSV